MTRITRCISLKAWTLPYCPPADPKCRARDKCILHQEPHARFGPEFYHNQSAMTLRALATDRNRSDYFQRAIKHYEEADYHFTLARHLVYRAHVKNNIGYLLFKLSRFRKAHEYLDQARRLLVSVRDKVRVAQVDDTRAQVLIEQHKYAEAEAVARNAVSSFRKAGRECFLAEALVTHGIALARLTKTLRARSVLQEAAEVAHRVGALNQAGIAALTLIEEIEPLRTAV